LIPVTGADLSAETNAHLVFVNRVHQLQTGLNLLGVGFMLIGLVMMVGKREDE